MSAMYLHNTNTSTSENQVPFQPTWLYIKQHNKTGLRYFGMTKRKDPTRYMGSGTYWNSHIKKHGKDIATPWCQLFTNRQQLIEYAISFSKQNNIVNSKEWANLKIEDGNSSVVTQTTKQRMSAAKKGSNNSFYNKHHLPETKIALSKANQGKVIPDSVRQQISLTLTGISRSEETKQKMSKPKTEETKQKMRKPKTEETKQKMRLAWQKRKAKASL